jgi:hypothetical protein
MLTITTFTPNLERLKTVAFTDPYTTSKPHEALAHWQATKSH